MDSIVIPPEFANQVFTDFTHLCHVCGKKVTTINAQEQPHQCRIEISRG